MIFKSSNVVISHFVSYLYMVVYVVHALLCWLSVRCPTIIQRKGPKVVDERAEIYFFTHAMINQPILRICTLFFTDPSIHRSIYPCLPTYLPIGHSFHSIHVCVLSCHHPHSTPFHSILRSVQFSSVHAIAAVVLYVLARVGR